MHRPTLYIRTLIFLFSLVLAPALVADVITVGTDGPCNFADLQEAIDAAWDGAFIHVQQGEYGSDQRFLMHDKSLTVRGGYDKCWGDRVGRSTLYVKDDERVLSIRSLDKRATVRLSYLEVTGAQPDAPFKAVAGGIDINGDVDVEMQQVEVHHAYATTGGGIRISSVQVGISERRPTLTLLDSRIYRNSSFFYGGGLSCTQANMAIANTAFDSNESQAGAGLSLTECEAVVLGEIGPLELAYNFADLSGAGMILSQSELTVEPGKDGRTGLEVIGNLALRSGGGIHLAGDSLLEADGVLFKENIAFRSGGALSAWDSTVRIGQNLGSCYSSFGCQRFEDNFAILHGGAITLFDDAEARLDAVRARGNSAGQQGGGFASVYGGSSLHLTNAVLTANKGKTLIDAAHSRSLTLTSSTVFSNDIDEVVLSIPEAWNVHISQSILHENGAGHLAGGFAQVDCSFFDDVFGIPAGAVDSAQGDPLFVAPGSFRLAFETPVAEMCDDTSPHAEVDFDFEARPSRGRFEPGADELD